MNGREFWELRDVSNEQLETSLGELLGAVARVEARIVAHLAEVDARRLHLRAGCSSLFDYCRKRLALSEYEAFVRIAVARVARKYPMVFGMLLGWQREIARWMHQPFASSRRLRAAIDLSICADPKSCSASKRL
jgi:hypothetical protein